MVRRWKFGMLGLSLMGLIGIAACLHAEEGTVSFTPEEQAVLKQAQIMSKAFAIVARKVMPSVVNIRIERTKTVVTREPLNDPYSIFPDHILNRFFQRPQARKYVESGLGSGVILDPRGYIVTNYHVVKEADQIYVKLSDGRELESTLIGASPESDLAVLKIEAKEIQAAAMGNSDDCLVGEMVLAIGNSFGLESTVTNGTISAKGRSGVGIVDYEDFIQTDAPINPGNSGGPLVSLKGEVIGINTALFTKAGGYQGIGFAIPVNIVRNVMTAIITNKKVTQSYLGVDTQPLTAELATSFGLKSPRGALIASVLADTPAAKAGIRRGDVITHYGKRLITDDQHLRNLIATTPPDETVPLLLVREGREMSVSVKMEPVPEKMVIARGREFMEDLGIEVSELTEELRGRLGYEPGAEGVLVTEVQRGSLAHKIRITPGSLILKINDKEVKTPAEISKALAHAQSRRSTQKNMEIVWRIGRYLLRKTLRFE